TLFRSFKDFVIDIFNLTEIASFIYLIPLVIIFAGLGQISQQWLIRTNQFAINAKTTFLLSFIFNSSKVGVGLVYPFASVLVVLQTLSEALKAFLMFAFVRKSDYKSNNSTENNLSLKQLAKKHRSEEHTSELQSRFDIVCRLLLEKKKTIDIK